MSLNVRAWRLAGPTLGAALLLVAASLACAAGEPGSIVGPGDEPPARTAPKRPVSNVLIVVLDDVGVEHVAAYGKQHSPPPTPTLDALAATGVRFLHAWSNPVCSPTRAAIMTGRHASRTGIGQIIDSWKDEHELLDSEITIAEVLDRSADRWDTSAVGKWHLGSERVSAAMHPGRQGFDWWAGSMGNLRDVFGEGRGEDHGYFTFMKNVNGKVREVSRYVTTDTTDDAIERMQKMQEPWLLYVAYNAAHYPMHVPPPQLTNGRVPETASDQDKFDAIVTAVDKDLGRMLASMSPELRARTTVMVVGDNGTPDFAIRPPLDPERAKGSLYELGVHVPLLVTGPQVKQPGSTSKALVHVVDLFATTADIAGVDVASLGRPIDGRSLLPMLADPTASTRTIVFTEKFAPNGPGPRDRHGFALRTEGYKLIVDRKANRTTTMLFDMANTSDEGRNLLAKDRVPKGEAADALQQMQSELARLEGSFKP